MSYQKEYVLHVDIKKSTSNVTPTFSQYDKASLIIKVYDDGLGFDFSNFKRAEVIHRRPNGTLVYGLGELVDLPNDEKAIRYVYLGGEMSIVGNVLTSVSIFSNNDEKISINPFYVKIVKDIREEVSDLVQEEFSIIEQYVSGAEDIVTEARRASNLVNSAMQDIQAHIVTLENISLEEEQRASNEAARISNENTRIQDMNNRVHRGVFSPNTQYLKHNEVSYEGSTYRCLSDSLGTLPTDTSKWIVVSLKGEDATGGTVTSINDILPDEDGNLILTPEDIGLGAVTNESKETMFTSPDFTGVPTSPTPTNDSNSTQIATTAFVKKVINNITGTLGSLTTTVKTSIVDSINHLKSTMDAHTSNASVHATPEEKVMWNGKYTKPATGIPKADLSAEVQILLEREGGGSTGNITIPDASTTTKGIVQLNNTLTSTSTNQAVTAAQAKVLNDKITSHTNNAATTSRLGHVQPDGVTITINDLGVISAIGGGGEGGGGGNYTSIIVSETTPASQNTGEFWYKVVD